MKHVRLLCTWFSRKIHQNCYTNVPEYASLAIIQVKEKVTAIHEIKHKVQGTIYTLSIKIKEMLYFYKYDGAKLLPHTCTQIVEMIDNII